MHRLWALLYLIGVLWGFYAIYQEFGLRLLIAFMLVMSAYAYSARGDK